LHVDSEHPGALPLLAEFVSGILGRTVDVGRLLTADERAMLFRHLTRQDELKILRQPGERLVWTAENLAATERERLPVPHLDRFVAALQSRLPQALVPVKPRWPDGQPFAVCLSHDMDHVTAFSGRERWRRFACRSLQAEVGLQERLSLAARAAKSTLADWVKRDVLGRPDRFGNIGAWLKLEADCGFKSSLYFFADTVAPWHHFDCNYGFCDRVQFEGRTASVGQVMREIAGRGWEVAVHGSIASATEPGVLERQKQEVEGVIGQPVLTTRQHYLQYDPARTPAIQAAAGLLADGTQGFNDTIGFRAGTSFPYRVWDWAGNRLLRLWQVPLHIQDGPLLRQWKTTEEAVAACVRMLDQVQHVGGCLGILFHPAQLVTELGFAVYQGILQEARRRNAWGTSMREVAQWWNAQVRAVLTTALPTVHT
jgi:hypothetical protein